MSENTVPVNPIPNPPTPSPLLPQGTLNAISAAFKLIAGMFFVFPLTFNHNSTQLDEYGEKPLKNRQSADVTAMYEYSVGQRGRYHNLEETDMGNILKDGWKVYVMKDVVDALPFTINPEADTVTVNGKEYEIRMWSPSAGFSDLGFILYEFECHFNNAPGQ